MQEKPITVYSFSFLKNQKRKKYTDTVRSDTIRSKKQSFLERIDKVFCTNFNIFLNLL